MSVELTTVPDRLMTAIARLPVSELRSLLRSTRLERLRGQLEQRAERLRRRLASVDRKLRQLDAKLRAVESRS